MAAPGSSGAAAIDPPAAPLQLLHVVALRFRDDLSDAEITAHFERDVALTRRMPELVASWAFKRNVSLKDRGDVNGGCQWVVFARLFDSRRLPEYLAHPEHVAIGVIQGPLITGKFVIDCEGDRV